MERLRRQATALAACFPDVRLCPPHVREKIDGKCRQADAIEAAYTGLSRIGGMI